MAIKDSCEKSISSNVVENVVAKVTPKTYETIVSKTAICCAIDGSALKALQGEAKIFSALVVEF